MVWSRPRWDESRALRHMMDHWRDVCAEVDEDQTGEITEEQLIMAYTNELDDYPDFQTAEAAERRTRRAQVVLQRPIVGGWSVVVKDPPQGDWSLRSLARKVLHGHPSMAGPYVLRARWDCVDDNRAGVHHISDWIVPV